MQMDPRIREDDDGYWRRDALKALSATEELELHAGSS
jgi:hypothetical protein